MNVQLAWKYYLRFLWSCAGLALFGILYGIYSINEAAKDNPAAGLAMVGAVQLFFFFLLFLVFIGINHLIHKRLQERAKKFLIVSWCGIAAVFLLSIGYSIASHLQ